jgi:SAM-dependent methyltransferase
MNFEAIVGENPCDLCFIMNFYGSDKGHPENDCNHTYTRMYNELFKDVRNDHLRVFELGLGTNNTDVPSNMGVNGKPGASLRGWRQYFQNAQVFGADIDKRILFKENRIETFYCDQNNPDAIRALWDNDVLHDNFDIIIEDGLHIFDSNVCFFENSWHKLNVGGIYIIEDIMHYTLDQWRNKIKVWSLKYENYSFRLSVLPHERNPHDNTILIVQRRY